jgi:hypothetical protein
VNKRTDIGERIAEGYRRVPQTDPDEWGDPTETSDIATGELLQRLDIEDRAAPSTGNLSRLHLDP